MITFLLKTCLFDGVITVLGELVSGHFKGWVAVRSSACRNAFAEGFLYRFHPGGGTRRAFVCWKYFYEQLSNNYWLLIYCTCFVHGAQKNEKKDIFFGWTSCWCPARNKNTCQEEVSTAKYSVEFRVMQVSQSWTSGASCVKFNIRRSCRRSAQLKSVFDGWRWQLRPSSFMQLAPGVHLCTILGGWALQMQIRNTSAIFDCYCTYSCVPVTSHWRYWAMVIHPYFKQFLMPVNFVGLWQVWEISFQ